MQPQVSIITVCFNSEKTIKDTIESVLNQTYTNIEYILIDGKSTDKTVEIIKSYQKSFEEKGIVYSWVSELDKGIYDAMNKGILQSKGEIIGVINSDDWYENNAVLEAVKKHKNQDNIIISGEVNKVDFYKKERGIRYNKRDIHKYIHKMMPINHPATFVHKIVYEKVGLFDIQYKLSADYDFIFRAFNSGARFLFIDKPIVSMRNSGATGQLKNLFVTAREDHHIRKKNNVSLYQFYYLKRIGFNFLIIIRDTFKKIMNKR